MLTMFLSVSRGHFGGVYDLCWSSDSRYIVSGSVDNCAITWDTQKGNDSTTCFWGTSKQGLLVLMVFRMGNLFFLRLGLLLLGYSSSGVSGESVFRVGAGWFRSLGGFVA